MNLLKYPQSLSEGKDTWTGLKEWTGNVQSALFKV